MHSGYKQYAEKVLRSFAELMQCYYITVEDLSENCEGTSEACKRVA